MDSDIFDQTDSPNIFVETKEIKNPTTTIPAENPPASIIPAQVEPTDLKVKEIMERVKKKYNFEKRPRETSADKGSCESAIRNGEIKKKIAKDNQSISISSILVSPNSSSSSKTEEAKEIKTEKPKCIQPPELIKEIKPKPTIIEIPLNKELKLIRRAPSKATIGCYKVDLFKCESLIAEEMSAHLSFQKLYQKAQYKEKSSKLLFDILAESFELKSSVEAKHEVNKQFNEEIENFIMRFISKYSKEMKKKNIITHYLLELIKIFLKISKFNSTVMQGAKSIGNFGESKGLEGSLGSTGK